jgi:hypothetical protein
MTLIKMCSTVHTYFLVNPRQISFNRKFNLAAYELQSYFKSDRMV